MRVIETVGEAQAHVAQSSRRRVLVPTMGALHKGHLELLRTGRGLAGAAGELQVSIYVNSLQFEPGSDFERYPRPFEEDRARCEEAGVDLIFRPSESEMYHADRSVRIEETKLARALCGPSRPGHFEGVCTVVAKLFHLLAPAIAIFGEKDFQQLAIIRRMVRDLNFPVEISAVPTVREPDGLACSSRNQYLNAEERLQAPVIFAALKEAQECVRRGEESVDLILTRVRARIGSVKLARIDYAEIVHGDTLETRTGMEGPSQLAIAVFFGKTRLIDNIRLR